MENLKHYNQMQSLLLQYETKKITLNHLIMNLEALLRNLEPVNKEWESLFLKKWGVLEDIYSVSVVDEKPISTKSQEVLQDALKDLKGLILTAIQNTSSAKTK